MSLRSRIVLAITIVFASITLIIGWLVLTRAEANLQHAFDRTSQTRADWLLSLVSVDPVILPLPTATEQMRVVYQTYGHRHELFRSPAFPTANATTFSIYRTTVARSSVDQFPNGQVSLTLCVPDARLRQDIRQLRWVFGLGWLLSLAMAFVGGYVVAGWLLKPIQRIIHRANAINDALSIDSMPLPKSRDELYQLTDTLNRMLARIRENAELQRNFFGAAAHELRTPLTVMKTGLEVTLDIGRLDERTAHFLAGQLDEVSRLNRLVDEFLTLSRPDEGAQFLQSTPTNVTQLIETCVQRLQTMAADYEVTIRFSSSEQIHQPVWIDARKLEQVLLNLLENAIKYAVPGSHITVHWNQADTWSIQIYNQTVRENGPTLDLMQPYFQADPLREGHGLGLWISHRLTALMGGTLQLSWQQFTFTSTLILPITVH